MNPTLHKATVTTTGTGHRVAGYVLCVDAAPLVAVDDRGRTLHAGGREVVTYAAAPCEVPAAIYSLDELVEDYTEAAAAKPLVGVTFQKEA